MLVDVVVAVGGVAMLPVYALLIRILDREQYEDLMSPVKRILARVGVGR